MHKCLVVRLKRSVPNFRTRCFSSSICNGGVSVRYSSSFAKKEEAKDGDTSKYHGDLRFLEDEVERVEKDAFALLKQKDSMILEEESSDFEEYEEPTLADLDRSIPQVDCEFIASLVRCRNYQRSFFLEKKTLLKEKISSLTEKRASSVLDTLRFRRLGGFDVWGRQSADDEADANLESRLSPASSIVVAPEVLETLTSDEKDILHTTRPEYNDGFTLLDCRTVNEVISWGIIEGAKVLPAHELFSAFHASPDVFERNFGFKKPHPDEKIICYCQFGPRSLMAAQMLSWMGYEKVLHFREGFYEWGKQYNLLLRRWMEHDRISGNELRRMAAFRAALEMQRDIAPEFNMLPMKEAAVYRLDVSRSPGTLKVGDGLRAEAYAALAQLTETVLPLEEREKKEPFEKSVTADQMTKFLEEATGIDANAENQSETSSFTAVQESSLQFSMKEEVDPFTSK